MEDTDWRPSKCPHCGVIREARRNPKCENPQCKGVVGSLKYDVMLSEATRDEHEHKRAMLLKEGIAHIEALESELKGFRDNRAYVMGHNQGWDDALEFAATVFESRSFHVTARQMRKLKGHKDGKKGV